MLFNAKLGQKAQGEPENIRNFGLPNKNSRCEMSSTFKEKKN